MKKHVFIGFLAIMFVVGSFQQSISSCLEVDSGEIILIGKTNGELKIHFEIPDKYLQPTGDLVIPAEIKVINNGDIIYCSQTITNEITIPKEHKGIGTVLVLVNIRDFILKGFVDL